MHLLSEQLIRPLDSDFHKKALNITQTELKTASLIITWPCVQGIFLATGI